MRISGINVPQPLLSALQDGDLVILAGAGVSMGSPANLPSYSALSRQIAAGTGQARNQSEPEDRFLNRLRQGGVDVKRLASDILQANAPEPTELHRNLLLLSEMPERVRIVTTNFDPLFELAAKSLFNTAPEIFSAPVLPYGQRFEGIVHVHGEVSRPGEMILTSQDFGRAYLTESEGWARRFLVDLFARYTALFIGYSHNDTIMTYLTPSLPPEDQHKRFALVGDQTDDLDHWNMMGIEPVTFRQASANDFSALETAMVGLATFVRRGVLDWQHEITTIASGYPPIDDEGADIIEHALTDPVMMRFFVESAELPEWVEWLSRRGHLAKLFTEGGLNEQEQALGWWLVSRFAITHDSTLFALVRRHGGRINSALWRQLAWQMKDGIPQPTDKTVVTRWVLFLANAIPLEADDFDLLQMAKACASIHATDSLLRVYEATIKRLNQVPPRPELHNYDASNYHLRELLSECIMPDLHEMAEPLLALVTTWLKERHAISIAWEDGEGTAYRDNYSRSAIEPHQQDDLNEEIDPLIDAARECLEWLAANISFTAGAWCDRFASAEAPLLRRLAVHAFAARTDLSADDKIAWLLERCDVNEIAAHHEIFRAVAQEYPQTSSLQRTALIQAISDYRAPESIHHDNQELSARHSFTWYHWLHQADPDCSIAKEALDTVWGRYQHFGVPEHADFTHYYWSQTSSLAHNTWNVDGLLSRQATESLPDLLNYQPDDQELFDGHGRWAMLSAVRQAAGANPSWGLDLADAMVETEKWNSDLWQPVMNTWPEAELDQRSMKRVLSHLSAGELHRQHSRGIADIINKIISKAEGPETMELQAAAISIAVALRSHAHSDEPPQLTASVGGAPQYVTWLTRAINQTSGVLAQFWIHSIVLWRRHQEPIPQQLSTEYREALDAIIEEAGLPGKFGRTVLASNFHFFLAVDEDWTIKNLLPLFDTENEDFQCAWDGYLTWGRLSPQIADLLKHKFITAVPRVFREFQGNMLKRFVEFYVTAMGWLIDGPNDDWITEFFKHAATEQKNLFASAIGRILRDLDESRQQEWWNVWLKEYWRNRLQGVPVRLDDAEIAEMLEWVIHLSGVFPEAVAVAVQMPPRALPRSFIFHDLLENELIESHPDDLAEFIVHLGRYDTATSFWIRAREVVDQLLAKVLRKELNHGLRELIVRHRLN